MKTRNLDEYRLPVGKSILLKSELLPMVGVATLSTLMRHILPLIEGNHIEWQYPEGQGHKKHITRAEAMIIRAYLNEGILPS